MLPAARIGAALAFVACFAACGSRLPTAGAIWERHDGLAPGPVKLVRKHAVGERWLECVRTQLDVTIGPKPAKSIMDTEVRFEVTEAPAGGPFGVSFLGGSASSETQGFPRERRDIPKAERPSFVRANNGPIRAERAAAPPPVQKGTFDFQMLVSLADLIDDPWPERAVRAGERWEAERSWPRYGSDGTPTQRTRRTRWHFVGIEGDRFAHLRCDGTWSAHAEAYGPAGEKAVGRSGGRFSWRRASISQTDAWGCGASSKQVRHGSTERAPPRAAPTRAQSAPSMT